ncbi:Predicted histone tail methylase containing SET domain [Phaffia rhodozyma]|uniref:Predicted histone tail methylase containing SET domain n=1 Tax=Phaffia rhodozyma TaxID=264483 RepID=A0A0F7SI31_PHARH|nr:Predicted histone tail methylase containing SET domain [Phaffia rhodozyma]
MSCSLVVLSSYRHVVLSSCRLVAFYRTFQDLKTLLRTEDDLHRQEVRRAQGLDEDERPLTRRLPAYDGKHFSTRPLQELERVELGDMMWHKIHHGQYLLIRIVSRPTRITSIRFIGQDPSGRAELVELQTAVDMLVQTGPELDALYPMGGLLAIREPHYVRCLDEDMIDIAHWKRTKITKVSRIRVESPSDVIWLGADDRLVSELTWMSPPVCLATETNARRLTAEHAKSIGDERLDKGWLMAAERAYTEGLTVDSKHIVLRLDRAHCRIRLSRFRGAFVDGEHALRGLLDAVRAEEPGRADLAQSDLLQKAYHWLVLASIGLRDWSVAYEHCTVFVERFPDYAPALDLLAFTQARVDEARTGVYDWPSIFRGDLQPGGTRNVVADWVSPSFKIGRSPTLGGIRGVIADRTIERGELLVVCKPFVSVDMKEPKEGPLTELVNVPIQQYASGSAHAYLVRAMVDKIQDEPRALDVLKRLYAGPGSSDPELVDLSAFEPPGAPGDTEDEEEEVKSVDVDVSRLEGVRTYSSFATGSVIIAETGPTMHGPHRNEPCSGIYLVPSLFNHACFANVSWVFWDDIMVLRSRRTISPGEELTINYFSCSPLAWRTALIGEYGIDRCECNLCKEERLDPLDGREIWFDDLEWALEYDEYISGVAPIVNGKMYKPPRRTLEGVMKMTRSIESTYNSNRSPGFMSELCCLYNCLSGLHMSEATGGMKHPEETLWLMEQAVYWKKRALECCGFKGIESDGRGTLTSSPFAYEMECLSIGLSIVSILGRMDRKKDAQRWARVVLEMHDIVFGGGKETLVVLWRGPLDSMHLLPYFS